MMRLGTARMMRLGTAGMTRLGTAAMMRLGTAALVCRGTAASKIRPMSRPAGKIHQIPRTATLCLPVWVVERKLTKSGRQRTVAAAL
jgi:hypothetical protein